MLKKSTYIPTLVLGHGFLGLLECLPHLCEVRDIAARYTLDAVEFEQIALVRMRRSLEDCKAKTYQQPLTMHHAKGSSPFNLAILFSLNRFFGNMPLTARLSTSPPPHFSIILSIDIDFKLPGRVLCV